MIGIYGLSDGWFELIYSNSKDYYNINNRVSNCHGKSFDAILSYESKLSDSIVQKLYSRLNSVPLTIHIVKGFK